MRRRLIVAFTLAAVAAPSASAGRPGPPGRLPPPQAGSLVQLGGPTGCVTTQGGGCSQSPLLKGAWDVKVSPDGLNVYAAARYSNAVVVFRRDPTTGGLTLLPGTATCISRDGSGGFCTQGRDLYQPVSLAFSADGRFLLVASRLSNGVAVFQRDLSSGPLHGQLTQPAGKAGCINTSGAQGCASSAYTALDRARAVVAVGSYVYVAVPNGGFVDVLAQVQSTGELEQLPLPYGCIATNGGAFAACTKAPPMPAPVALAVSGSHLLIASNWHYNTGDADIFEGSEEVDTLVEVPLDSAGLAHSDPGSQCFAASDSALGVHAPSGCDPLGDTLLRPYSITASPRGDVIAVGTVGAYEMSLFGRLGDGSLAYLNCLGGLCSNSTRSVWSAATAAVFSDDAYHLYTPVGVWCRLEPGYVPCAATHVGHPEKANGDTNVIPTAMATSPDGSTVYLTFGTPSGYPTKMGGVYVLHAAT